MNEQFINDLSKELAKLGTIHSVGEEWISYTGKIPSGGIPYYGQEVTRETYSALWSWVQAQGLVKTESEWQSIASSQNGNVPFYSSGNGTTTFRMPKLVGYVKGACSQSEAGSYVAEGLPNITGKSTYNMIADNFGAEGAFDLSGRAAHQNGTAMGEGTGLGFNASLSNPIYGNSSHVTPETSVVMFGVYAFGTVSNPNDLNVSNLAADVNSIKTSYLPLSGGTMTGKITSSSERVLDSTNANGLFIVADANVSSTKTGAISVFPVGHSQANRAGGFQLVASDGTNNKTLTGSYANGLKWDSKNVVCSVNGSTADASGNVTVTVDTANKATATPNVVLVKGNSTTLPSGGTWKYVINSSASGSVKSGSLAGGKKIEAAYSSDTSTIIAIRVA